MRDKTKFLILGIIIASFLCIGVVGCAALFGEPGYVIPATYNPAGEIVSATQVVPPTTGLVQQGAATANAAGSAGIPYAGLVGSILGLIGAAGAAVQTMRHKSAVKQGAAAMVAYEQTPSTTTGPGSAMETIAEVAPKLLALYQQMQKK